MDNDRDAFQNVHSTFLFDTEQPPRVRAHLLPKSGERVCFVITKNRQNSWVDDLYACERIRKGDHVYN